MINIYMPEENEILIDVSYGYTDSEIKKGRYKPGEGIIGTVFETGNPVVIPSIENEPKFLNKTGARSDDFENISFICIPIKVHDKTIGTISIDLHKEDENFSEEMQTLTVLSIIISQAVSARSELLQREKDLKTENKLLKLQLHDSKSQNVKLIGKSSTIESLYEKILLVAETETTVLITGESGTGKELVADALHYNSKRNNKPFVKVNIASLPKNLIESELFGYEKGAFTGAFKQKIGRFELANGGTIFLDEIGDLDLALQVHLLRVIQERSIERLGGIQTIPLDVRIIAATHQNLEDKMKKGLFREDLFYRLNVFPLYVPPLRDRKSDIIMLSDYFLDKYSSKYNKNILRISSEAIDMLSMYHWPGNVRELENCIERAVILSGDEVLRSYNLPPSLQFSENETIPATLDEMTNMFVKEIIIDQLKITKGNMTKAAINLGTTKRILNYKVKSLEINYKKYKE